MSLSFLSNIPIQPTPQPDLEREKQIEFELRAGWTAKGVPEGMQDAMIQEVADKAKPGAQIGPWKIGQ
jgi:hypothetical protein